MQPGPLGQASTGESQHQRQYTAFMSATTSAPPSLPSAPSRPTYSNFPPPQHHQELHHPYTLEGEFPPLMPGSAPPSTIQFSGPNSATVNFAQEHAVPDDPTWLNYAISLPAPMPHSLPAPAFGSMEQPDAPLPLAFQMDQYPSILAPPRSRSSGESPVTSHPRVSAASSASTSAKSRTRAKATVCTFCRARKLRCDGDHPCRQCERRKLECVYLPFSASGSGTAASSGTSAAVATSASRKGKSVSRSASSYANASPAAQQSPLFPIYKHQHQQPQQQQQNDPLRSISSSATSQVAAMPSTSSRTGVPSSMTAFSNTPHLSTSRAPAGLATQAPPADLVTDSARVGPSSSSSRQPPQIKHAESSEARGLHSLADDISQKYAWLRYEVSSSMYDDADDASIASEDERDNRREIEARGAAEQELIRARAHAEAAVLPREPDNRSSRNPHWYETISAVFGPSKVRSKRVMTVLVDHFSSANNIFFGLVHPAKLKELLSDADTQQRTHPALLPAILAVAAIDIKSPRAEPYSADLTMIDDSSRTIHSALYQEALAQIQATIESGSMRDVSMAQATSLLALATPHSKQKTDLLRLLEQTIQGNKWDSFVPEVPGSASSPTGDWYSRPTSDPNTTAEASIHLESLIRICWSPFSHWIRDMILSPHELRKQPPPYLQKLRTFGVWDPSTLPEKLPESFYCTQEIFRIGVVIARVAHSAEILLNRSPTIMAHSIADTSQLLDALDSVETRIAKVRSAEVEDTVDHLQMSRKDLMELICCAAVPLRLAVWREVSTYS